MCDIVYGCVVIVCGCVIMCVVMLLYYFCVVVFVCGCVFVWFCDYLCEIVYGRVVVVCGCVWLYCVILCDFVCACANIFLLVFSSGKWDRSRFFVCGFDFFFSSCSYVVLLKSGCSRFDCGVWVLVWFLFFFILRSIVFFEVGFVEFWVFRGKMWGLESFEIKACWVVFDEVWDFRFGVRLG